MVSKLAHRFRMYRERITQWILEHVLGAPPEVIAHLGQQLREGTNLVHIETRHLWKAEPFLKKVRALFSLHWRPNDEILRNHVLAVCTRSIFGGPADCGEHLANLYEWHSNREWKLDALQECDRARAHALGAFTVLTRRRYEHVADSSLNLRLAARNAYLSELVYPMVAKVPIVSLRYFLEVEPYYTFNAIRQSSHVHVDDIIGFLYDLLLLQQKTAMALLEYAEHTLHAEQHKADSILTKAEVDAIMSADTLFSYLKASVEKTIALVGLTHCVPNLDSKKEHKKRVAALRASIGEKLEKVPYGDFLLTMVGSEHLDDLNKYRTGLLHKKGIADLQPHNYVGHAAAAIPLQKVFTVMHDQHVANTQLLFVALALLTDELVRLDPPSFGFEDLPVRQLVAGLPARIEAEEAEITRMIAEREKTTPGKAPAEYYVRRALVRRTLGRHQECLSDLQEALARGVERKAEVLYELGITFMDLSSEDKDKSAVEAFSAALVLEPTLERAFVGRALANENLGELKLAEDDLNQVPKIVEANPELLEKRGIWRVQLGKYNDALADLDAAAALGHEPLDLLTARGCALRSLGNDEAGLEALDIAIARFPEAVVARLERATTLVQRKEDQRALLDLDAIVAINPNHYKAPFAFSLRALIRYENKLAGAVADMEEAISRHTGVIPEIWTELLQKMKEQSADSELPNQP